MGSKKRIICIVVPVYNVEKYLNRCIDSILSQTFIDYDLILIDDGSKDLCGIICDGYAKKDSRIHVIHQENQGLSAARNAGIEWSLSKSESEWITFVDSDDWVHPQYLELLYSAAIECGTEISIGEALWTEGEPLPYFINGNPKLWKTCDYYTENITNATVAWGKLYRKNCFKEIRYPVGKIHEDEYVTYKILFQHEYIAVIDAYLYAYFQNSSGIMKSKWTPARLDALGAFEEQVDFFLENGNNLIAKRCFYTLVNNIKNSQQQIQQCNEVNPVDKLSYIRQLKRRLRWLLIRYSRYHLLPFRESEKNKQIYMNAFTVLRISRRMWGTIAKRLIGEFRAIMSYVKK